MAAFSFVFALPGLTKRAPKAAKGDSSAPVAVYVEAWQVAPEIRLSGHALEVALCVHLMKDKRVEAQCEGDVRELLNFSADSALAGNQTPVIEELMKRLQKTRWILRGEVQPLPGGKWRMILRAHEKDPASVGVQLVAGAHVNAVEMEVAAEEHAQVLTFIPRLSDRLLDKLLGAGGLGRMPPPAPLSSTPPAKTRSR